MSNFIECIPDEQILELSMFMKSFERDFWLSDLPNEKIGYLKVFPRHSIRHFLKIDDDYYVKVIKRPLYKKYVLENLTTISPVDEDVFEELKVAKKVHCSNSAGGGFYLRW